MKQIKKVTKLEPKKEQDVRAREILAKAGKKAVAGCPEL